MLSKLRALFNRHKELILYVVFGGLTTLINYIIYFPLFNYCGFSAAFSNAIAWLMAVFFSFLVNKQFVFKSYDWSAKMIFPEALKFAGCRVGSGLIETAALFVTADILQLDGNIWKLVVSVLVIIINYVGSKLLVFRKR